VRERQISGKGGLHTDLDWAVLLVGALFVHDGDGRLVARRGPRAGHPASSGEPPDSRPAPAFVFVRTRHGNLWRFRADLDPEVVCGLARLAAKEAPLADSAAPAAGGPPPERLEAWRRVLGGEDRARGEALGHEKRGWALRLPEPVGGAGRGPGLEPFAEILELG
jgi:hypothetical protein